MTLTLFHGEGSNCCQRVKWVLGYKGIAHATVDIAPFMDAEMQALAPLASVPCLKVGDVLLTESMAIVEFLEETHPTPALLPRDPLERAVVRALCEAANTYVHPGQRTRLAKFFLPAADDASVKDRRRAWLEASLTAVERLVRDPGPFAAGADFSLADIFLVPLYVKYLGFGGEPRVLPRLERIRRLCKETPRIAAAAPGDLRL